MGRVVEPFEIGVVKSGEVEKMELSAFMKVNESASESVHANVSVRLRIRV